MGICDVCKHSDIKIYDMQMNIIVYKDVYYAKNYIILVCFRYVREVFEDCLPDERTLRNDVISFENC